MSKVFKNHRELWLAIGLVVIVSAIAYLPLAARLGYYHDDWFTTVARVTGTSLSALHRVDRPGMGVLYQFVSDILGEAPIAWHLFAWAARAAGALALLWLARMLWPEQKTATTLMAVVYAVYPGFLQQPSANNYQNHLLAYLACTLSLALTVKSIRSPGWLAKILFGLPALVLAYGYPRVYEAMIGIEGLRLILIWYALSGEKAYHFWKRFRQSLLWFTPFLLNMAYFIFWRFFIFQSSRYSVDAQSLVAQYTHNFFGMVASIFTGVIKDFFETVFGAWFVPLYQLSLDVRIRNLFIGIGLSFAAIFLIYVYSRYVRPGSTEDNPHSSSWAKDAVIIGGLGVLVTLLGVAFTGREVQFRNYLDRYTIQSIVPTAMLLVGGIWLIIRPNFRIPAIAGLITLAVLVHFFNAANYAANWELQRQVWWQLTWRAPQIEPATALIVQMPNAYRYPEGFEVWAPANLTYFPQQKWPIISSEVLNNDTLPAILAGTTEPRNFRGVEFEINFSNTLVLSMPSINSCLHTINGSKPELSQFDYQLTRQVAGVSKLEQIATNGTGVQPPAVIFGHEPEHEWCYYYQKADLARQRGDWQEVVRLGEEAAQKGFTAGDLVEWAPFFEAYLHLNRLHEAGKLADLILAAPGVAEGLCANFSVDSTSVGFNASQLLCSTQ